MSEAHRALIADLSEKLGNAYQAKKNLDQMIEKIAAFQATITAAALEAAVIAVPAAAAAIDFHLNKTSGSFGSYGVNNQLAQLTAMQTGKEAEITFFELAIGIYKCLDKGLAIPSDISFPPGYDPDAGTLYNVDMDHPASRNRFEAGADLHLENRPFDIDLPLGYILPLSSQIGDLICLNGIQFIFTDETSEMSGYWPVGLQEPPDACDRYDNLVHTVCEIGGGGM